MKAALCGTNYTLPARMCVIRVQSAIRARKAIQVAGGRRRQWLAFGPRVGGDRAPCCQPTTCMHYPQTEPTTSRAMKTGTQHPTHILFDEYGNLLRRRPIFIIYIPTRSFPQLSLTDEAPGPHKYRYKNRAITTCGQVELLKNLT